MQPAPSPRPLRQNGGEGKGEGERLDVEGKGALVLAKMILEDQERLRREKIMGRIVDLRKNLGRKQEDTALWVQLAREERIISHDSRR